MSARAETLAAAMLEAAREGAGDDPVANAGTPEGARKGWQTRRRNGWTPQAVERNRRIVGDLAREVYAGGGGDRAVAIGAADGEEAADIKRLTGIDADGFEHEVAAGAIRHGMKRHGPVRRTRRGTLGERDPAQIPLAEEDFARLPEIYSSYDRMTAGTADRRTGYPSVRYHKLYPDGTEVAVDVVATGYRKLQFKTGWKLAKREAHPGL